MTVRLVNFVFPADPPVSGAEECYFRVRGGGVSCDEGGVTLGAGAEFSLDTFFNLFSAKYLRAADLSSFTLDFGYTGALTAEVRFFSASGDERLAREVFYSETAATGSIEIAADEYKCREGFFYAVFASHSGGARLTEGGFSADVKPKRVRIGAVVCTYRREAFVRENTARLGEYLDSRPQLASAINVFVVDNGRTLSPDDLPPSVRLIPNDNTGGAGGFTRGLREILEEGGYTHFLFMDDDIALEPAVLERTVALLSVLDGEYAGACVGGAMLMRDRPCIQHELGGRWLGDGLRGNHTDVDISAAAGLLDNESDPPADFGAWWYMCMPVSAAERHGLPLEMLFVKCDDVEYGLRAAEKLLFVNGIGVWHENFDSKFTPVYEYFVKRNELIASARYPRGKGVFANWAKFVRAAARALVEQNYFIIDIISKAYDDFLRGADYVSGLDSVALIKELSAVCPEQRPSDEVGAAFGVDPDRGLEAAWKVKQNVLLQFFTLNSYLLPRACYRKVAVAHMVKPRPIDFFRAESVVHYNPYTRTAYVTRIRKRELFRALNKIVCVFFKMLFRFGRAKRSFRKLR